ncbi:MAG: class I SAM-dependent methyltransferase [Candidatus Micrarchaeota archaeon]
MVNADKADYWQKMYSKKLEDIPWEIEKHPVELDFILKNKFVTGSRILDIACGSGNYSIYLAKLGFDVTAIDISEKAIKIAKEKAKVAEVKINFITGDFLEYSFEEKKFDFIFDYSIMHHITPDDILHYTKKEISLLDKDGILALVCYSDKDEHSQSKSSATGKFGNIMYYRNKEEIETNYANLKLLHYSETTLGKRLHHKGHFWVWKK